jgi:ATP-dependent Lon protease
VLKILDQDHFGLEEVKRMIEHLVLKLRNDISHQLYVTGPPGVGKTSIGRSEALGREYVRISLEVCVMSLKLEGIEKT